MPEAPSIDGSRPRGQGREFNARFDTRDVFPNTLLPASDTRDPVKRIGGRYVLLRALLRGEAPHARRRCFHRLLQLTPFTSTRNSPNSLVRGLRRAPSPQGLSACCDRRPRLAACSARVPLRLTPREELRSVLSCPGGQVIHHFAAALSTTCGADGGPLTLPVSSHPFPSHSPFPLPSSRAPTRGTSTNQSAFPHRGPVAVSGSFRHAPARRPARVGLSVPPPGQEESTGVDACLHHRALAHWARPELFTLSRGRFRPDAARWLLQSSRIPSTTGEPLEPQSRRRRSPVVAARPPCKHGGLGWPASVQSAEQASRTLDGTGAGVHAADQHACDRSQTRLYPDPRGPDTSCRDAAVSRVSAREGPSTSPWYWAVAGLSRGPLRLPSREGRPTTLVRGAFRPKKLSEESKHAE